ncbi:amidohydrolase family protein [Saccharomonospora sp. NPDC006951]
MAPLNSLRAYTHATVIGVAGGERLRLDQTVLVDGDTIAAIGPSAQLPIPAEAAVTDLSGKYVIPGLADMHVHSESDTGHERHFPALYVANGITTVREMWGKPLLHEWRRKVENGELLGPRSVIASPLVDGSPALWADISADSPIITATTAAQARRAVGEAIDSGADFVKVYSRLEREPYFAVLDEAARRGIPVAGHRSDNVPLAEQIEAGQRSFEHVHGLWPATAADADRLEAAMARISPGSGIQYANWFKQVNDIEWEATANYSAIAASSLFERMVAADVAYCPTLIMHTAVDLPDGIALDDPRLSYLTPETPQVWEFVSEQVFRGGGRDATETARRITLFGRRLAAVAAMDEAGVRLLAGTDAVTPGLFPGFSLHDELELLVRAGLSPLRALRAATIEPARFLGRAERIGSTEEGKLADFVVLDANPLDDIRNTREINAVVIDGRYLGPEERTALLTTASEIAAAHG